MRDTVRVCSQTKYIPRLSYLAWSERLRTELVFSFTNTGLIPCFAFHSNKQKSFSWTGGITFPLQTKKLTLPRRLSASDNHLLKRNSRLEVFCSN